ncbi:MAG: hypothetical protein KGO22_02445 [Gammaproteobacteria bacterium]|nr:hypothetical protein [Gammaproteobacteria bacterium]
MIRLPACAPDLIAVVFLAAGTGSALHAAGPPVVMKPELQDVFFLPGQPRLRRIFERDSSGRVVGYINRLAGQDLRARRT